MKKKDIHASKSSTAAQKYLGPVSILCFLCWLAYLLLVSCLVICLGPLPMLQSNGSRLKKKSKTCKILTKSTILATLRLKKKKRFHQILADYSCEIIFGSETMIFFLKFLYREHAYRHQQQLNLQFGGFGLTFWFYLTGISCDCLGVSNLNWS